MIIRIPEAETIRLRRILVDEDAAEALMFLKEHCEPAFEEIDRPHCMPVFDVRYKAKRSLGYEGRNGTNREE